MVLVSSKTAPQTGPAPSAVQGQAGASRGPGQIPNCPQHGGLGLGACPVFWNANCTSASSLQQEGAAGFLFSVPELGFPRAQAQKSSWENGQEHGSRGCCFRHLCSVVASHWDGGLFNTEDLGGRGSLTVDKGEIKGRNCQKVPLAVAAGMAAAGMGLPVPGSIFFFCRIR